MRGPTDNAGELLSDLAQSNSRGCIWGLLSDRRSGRDGRDLPIR